MSKRPLRLEFAGAHYHVCAQGDGHESIFAHDEDRRTFMAVLEAALLRFEAAALAYCLVDNHYHLVLHTRQPNLSQLMRHLNGVYTQRFNRRHNQVGHVFQGRYKATLFDPVHHLLAVCTYVDASPVRCGLARGPDHWPWGSCRALAGRLTAPPWLHTQTVWQALPVSARTPAAAYLEAVRHAPDLRLREAPARAMGILGSQDFQRQALALSAQAPRPEPRTSANTLADWLTECSTREEAFARTHQESRWTMTRIAAESGLSLQQVSRLVKRWRAGQAAARPTDGDVPDRTHDEDA